MDWIEYANLIITTAPSAMLGFMLWAVIGGYVVMRKQYDWLLRYSNRSADLAEQIDNSRRTAKHWSEVAASYVPPTPPTPPPHIRPRPTPPKVYIPCLYCNTQYEMNEVPKNCERCAAPMRRS